MKLQPKTKDDIHKDQRCLYCLQLPINKDSFIKTSICNVCQECYNCIINDNKGLNERVEKGKLEYAIEWS